MPGPIIVTGADRHYFLMGCLLMHSLAQWARDVPFYFLDFGLEDPQRKFLSDRGVLIERPPSITEGLHPIVAKMAIGEYLRDREWSTILWLDSDMLVVGSLRDKLSDVLTSMAAAQHEVAACSVEKISELVAGGWPISPFIEALRADQISFDSPYFNNASVLFRNGEFLDEWWRLGQQTPLHMLIDQNLFNLLALRRGGAMHLPARVWNLHGSLLADARIAINDAQRCIVSGETTVPPETALILHATSIRDQHHLLMTCGGGHGARQALKLFRNPILRDRQIETLSELLAEQGEALAKAGVERPDILLQTVKLSIAPSVAPSVAYRDPQAPRSWGKIGRLDPCPCGSGKRYKHCHGRYS